MCPPATRSRPSERNECPAQKSKAGLGIAVKMPGDGIPHLRHAGVAPGEHLPARQQAEMHRNDGPGERRGPLSGRTSARREQGRGRGRRCAGRAVVGAGGDRLAVEEELHRAASAGLDQLLAEGGVVGWRGREVRRTVFFRSKDPIGDADRNGIRVRDEEAIAADIGKTNRPITLLFGERRTGFGTTVGVGRFSAAEETDYSQSAEQRCHVKGS